MNKKIYDLAEECLLPVDTHRNGVQEFADKLLSMFNSKLEFIKNSDDRLLAIKKVEEEIYELRLSSGFSHLRSNKIYVVAGTHEQYKHFLTINGVVGDKSRYVYVSSADVIRGIRGGHFIYYGTYTDRKDYEELMYGISIANRV